MLFSQWVCPLIVCFPCWYFPLFVLILVSQSVFQLFSKGKREMRMKYRELSCTVVCVVLQWQAISLTVIEKVQIAAAILGSLFLMASISWLVWSSFSPSARWQRQDLLFQICYGMYGFMDVVCIGKVLELTLVCFFF